MRARRWFLICLTALGVVLSIPVLASAQQLPDRTVDIVELDGILDPVSGRYLAGRLDRAAADDVHALVIRIDSPGGLDLPVRSLVRKIEESPIPIVVWVAPLEAEIASAGLYLADSADLVISAESTNVDYGEPINLATPGRPVPSPQPTIEWTGGETPSLADLLRAMDGQEVEGRTLETWDEDRDVPAVVVRFQDMGVVEQLLHAITDFDMALILLLLGCFGLIFEVYNPGIGLGGILGTAALAMSLYGFSVLPTNWIGLALVVASILMALVDLHRSTLGIWSVLGLVALVTGELMLSQEAHPEVALSSLTMIAGVVLSLVFFISVMTAALRVRLRRPITGEESIVGAIGEARTDIAPEGTVFTKGALWRARTMETGIAAGSKVEIKATEGLVLLVEPLHEPDDAH